MEIGCAANAILGKRRRCASNFTWHFRGNSGGANLPGNPPWDLPGNAFPAKRELPGKSPGERPRVVWSPGNLPGNRARRCGISRDIGVRMPNFAVWSHCGDPVSLAAYLNRPMAPSYGPDYRA